MSIRKSIIEMVELLSLPSKQIAYEKHVPIADVPAELICGFCDDLYHPKSETFIAEFSEDELKRMAHLYGLLSVAAKIPVQSVTDLQRCPEWRSVVSLAKGMSAHYKQNPAQSGRDKD
ncbi:MAG: hypothetical protein O3A92_16655 [Verrucomicrobia bacterium]|nr:hypothetical protein [Verrucomicrobiota bacterium]